MHHLIFDDFFQGRAKDFLLRAIDAALAEDGRDLTSNAVFPSEQPAALALKAKEASLLAGLPLVPLVLERAAGLEGIRGGWSWEALAAEAAPVTPGRICARISGPARLLLRAERVILNFIGMMSGVAALTARYVAALEGTGVKLLDTRKTLPGLRYPQKYAVLAGGGHNHRLNLEDLLMLKDNHIDAAGSITRAVALLRAAYGSGAERPCPPIEAECRDQAEVEEAVRAGVDRIMLDNMDGPAIGAALPLIPAHIETEVSGGVSLANIRELALAAGSASAGGGRKLDFISVGRLTHSAPAADFSMIFSPWSASR
ncbi:MAG: carboxylating nicotinate-nucleotide diphosphorylase [Deltaproteobacteria bacterium]|jgi:nicotinate-nucleotide pyrophosphorylase (carboxylating)|nr:carboxylating nicotinate-nucleotide diphosphorylase [Deltaproteobacteria bacterium]